MLVADSRGFQEIIGVFFSLSLRDVLLYVFVKPDSLVEVDGLEIVEIDVIVDLCQFLHLLISQYVECLFLWDESIAEKAR